jgi:hypothetical protein
VALDHKNRVKHRGIRNGRTGRPTREEEIEAGIRCECGQMVDGHTPIPKPGPLSSWKASRPTDPAYFSGSSGGLGERKFVRNPAATAQAIRTRTERQQAKAKEWQRWTSRTEQKRRSAASVETSSNGHREADGGPGLT